MLDSKHSIALFFIILLSFNSFSQPIYSGPAFGQVSGGTQVSTSQFDKSIQLEPPGQRIINHHWESSKNISYIDAPFDQR